MSPSTALATSIDIDDLIAQRDAVLALLATAATALEEARTAAGSLLAAPRIEANWSYGREIADLSDAECNRRHVDASAWATVMQRSGLWIFLDARARKEWTEAVEQTARAPRGYDRDKPRLPAFTPENVKAVFAGIHAQRKDFVMRGVEETCRRLSARFKTNGDGDRFKRRMILTGVLSVWHGTSPGSHTPNELDDLTRVLCVLRGTPEPGTPGIAHNLIWEACREQSGFPKLIHFPFFDVRAFKNGNGHLTFLHDVDVDRLNAVLDARLSTQLRDLSLPSAWEKRR